MYMEINNQSESFCRVENKTERKNMVLITDDEPSVQRVLIKQLNILGCDCRTACNGAEALRKIDGYNYDLILLDINMPVMNGLEVLKKVMDLNHDTTIVMISSLGSVELVRGTLREGAYDYLIKPWSFEELEVTVKRALKHSRILKENREYQEDLERKVEERTKKLVNMLDEINKTYNETILALGSALETRDIETQAHSLRVSKYSLLLAHELGINDKANLTEIERGAYLHDIGKIGVPDRVLFKPAALTGNEWKIMKKHPEIGARMSEKIPFLQGAKKIIYYHHEHYNGTGYPLGLKGRNIPVEARIFAVADALDALLSDRPYRKGISLPGAKEIIINDSGKQFDPEVVEAFNKIREEMIV